MDDDPWSNGWSDPALNVDKEADISIPSWSTGSEIKWSEPSDIQGSLWSHSTDDDTWAEASSTYKGISLGPHPEIGTEDTGVSLPSPAHSEEPLENITTPKSPSPPPAHEPLDLPPSPDAFGSFETALDPTKMANIEDDDPWSASASVFPPNTDGVDQWGSAWTAPGVGAEALAQEEIPDEWEIAKQHKEKMDRQVPPERLASILQQCKLLSDDLWPDPEINEDIDKDDYTNDWRSGMAGIEGLAPVVARIIPEDMTLPPAIPFGKTFTAKHMAESVRLSRHFPLTRLSPMSQLMASKGSTAWETSVKSRPEIVQDDLPVGWRVIENNKETVAQVGADAVKGKKAGGGLLSFWGRKAVETKPERSLSPIRSQSASASPRSSVDSAKPQLVATTPPPAQPNTNEPITLASTPQFITTTPTAIAGPSISTPSAEPDPLDLTQPPPSAVSRFLGRFSRTKSNPTPNQRHSLALTSDDLEFLSDFVPSASDEHGELNDGDLQLDALSSMIKSSPLPTKLPLPIAPPPKGPTSRPISLGGAPKPQAQANDLDFIFSLSGSESTVKPATSSLPPPLLSASTLSVMSPSTKPAPPLPVTFISSAPRPTPVDKPLSSFALPPPPSPRTQTPILSPPPNSRPSFTKPISPPPLLPPPSAPSRTHTPHPSLIAPVATSLLSNAFSEDEFSDFHSPPPPPKASSQSAISLYDPSFSPQSSNGRLFSQQPSETSMSLSSSSFDDFDDFVSSPIRSPSPPVPPEKPPSRQAVVIPPPPPKTPSTHLHKASGAEHMHMTNRWPTPPSSLSPGPPQTNLLDVDFLGDASPPAKPPQAIPIAPSVSSPAWMTPARPTSSNAVNGATRLPPPQSAFSPSPLKSSISFSSGSAQLSVSASTSAASKNTSTSKTGGLSAQDLSFFEGL